MVTMYASNNYHSDSRVICLSEILKLEFGKALSSEVDPYNQKVKYFVSTEMVKYP